jgi:hypothetical protein
MVKECKKKNLLVVESPDDESMDFVKVKFEKEMDEK